MFVLVYIDYKFKKAYKKSYSVIILLYIKRYCQVVVCQNLIIYIMILFIIK